MTQFSKARWEADDKNVRMDIEFSKVNKEKRLVSGWATLDNVDTQNDIVLASASAKAFARAKGNLREMHKKDSAVGKIVSFREDTFRTPDGKKHNGIFVTAYVSKGAPDTWEKVLDGTLSAFSIGGSINESEEDFNKDANATVRIIKDYDLTELSLVDNPGNPLANIFQIQKSVDGSVTVKGMAADTDVINVFYCADDSIVSEKEDDTHSCPVCEKKMVNIGWVENGTDRSEKVNELVTKHLDTTDAISEGGDNMGILKKSVAPDEDESVATGHEEGDRDEIPTPARTEGDESESVEEVSEEENIEKSESVDEVPDEDTQLFKKIDELRDVVEKTLDHTRSETKEQIEALESKINELNKSFTSKASEFEAKFAELDDNFEVAKSRLAGFEKSLEKINAQGALRKSADFTESAEVEQDNDPWQGSAFSVRGLF